MGCGKSWNAPSRLLKSAKLCSAGISVQTAPRTSQPRFYNRRNDWIRW